MSTATQDSAATPLHPLVSVLAALLKEAGAEEPLLAAAAQTRQWRRLRRADNRRKLTVSEAKLIEDAVISLQGDHHNGEPVGDEIAERAVGQAEHRATIAEGVLSALRDRRGRDRARETALRLLAAAGIEPDPEELDAQLGEYIAAHKNISRVLGRKAKPHPAKLALGQKDSQTPTETTDERAMASFQQDASGQTIVEAVEADIDSIAQQIAKLSQQIESAQKAGKTDEADTLKRKRAALIEQGKKLSPDTFENLGDDFLAESLLSWRAELHPRTRLGEFAKKMRALKIGGVAHFPGGIRVERKENHVGGLHLWVHGELHGKYHDDEDAAARYIVKRMTRQLALAEAVADGNVIAKGRGLDMPDDGVRALQARLSELGFQTIHDGRFGVVTEEAVKAFQAKHGLDATGKVDEHTVAALREPPEPEKIEKDQAATEARHEEGEMDDRLEEVGFDPAKHPRGRGGEWIVVLGRRVHVVKDSPDFTDSSTPHRAFVAQHLPDIADSVPAIAKHKAAPLDLRLEYLRARSEALAATGTPRFEAAARKADNLLGRVRSAVASVKEPHLTADEIKKRGLKVRAHDGPLQEASYSSGGSDTNTPVPQTYGGFPGVVTPGQTSQRMVGGQPEWVGVHLLADPDDRTPGMDDFFGNEPVRVPPNLREAPDGTFERCGTCVHHNGKRLCAMYSAGTDRDDLCDSWLTLSPPQQIVAAMFYGRAVGEFVQEASRANAEKLQLARARLEEAVEETGGDELAAMKKKLTKKGVPERVAHKMAKKALARKRAQEAASGLPGVVLSEAKAHRQLKCPKCDTVQSATNKSCTNCGHDLSDARKALFAALSEGVTVESLIDDLTMSVTEAEWLALDEAADSMMKATIHEPVGKPGGPGLWRHKDMQLPAYIQHIANDLREKRGMDESRAIATAIAIVKRWASGVGKVHPDTRAAAAKAVAEWEKLKAEAKARRAIKEALIEATLDESEPVKSPWMPHVDAVPAMVARVAKVLRYEHGHPLGEALALAFDAARVLATQDREAAGALQEWAASRDRGLEAARTQASLMEAKLSAKKREKLPKSAFALPDKEAYPIHDESHARAALTMVAQHGTPEEKSKVRAAVKKRYPNIQVQEASARDLRAIVSAMEMAALDVESPAVTVEQARQWKREVELHEAAYPLAIHFDPRLHPRNRKGEFADVLGRLMKAGRGAEVTLPNGVTVKRARAGHGLTVTSGGRKVGTFTKPEQAASKALDATGIHLVEPPVHYGKIAPRHAIAFEPPTGTGSVKGEEVIRRAMSGEHAPLIGKTVSSVSHSPNTTTIHSYKEPLAHIDHGERKVYLNVHRYSSTSTRHRMMVEDAAHLKGYKIQKIDRAEALSRAGMDSATPFERLPSGVKLDKGTSAGPTGKWEKAPDSGTGIEMHHRELSNGRHETLHKLPGWSHYRHMTYTSTGSLNTVTDLNSQDASRLLRGETGGYVHLQGIGRHPAVKASDVKPGMHRVYNFGQTGSVSKVERKGNFVHITTTGRDGSEWTRKHKPDTLVPVTGQAHHDPFAKADTGSGAGPTDEQMIARHVKGGNNEQQSRDLLAQLRREFHPKNLPHALAYQGFITAGQAEKMSGGKADKGTGYLDEIVNYGGELMPRGSVIADLQKQGHPQAFIDRYLQGLDAGMRARGEKFDSGSGGDLPSFLQGLGPGKHEYMIGGVPFTLYYDEQGATGDSGSPVRGDKTGEWEVFRGHGDRLGDAIARVHVSPHGSSGYGNSGAPRYAAEEVARKIMAEVRKGGEKADTGSVFDKHELKIAKDTLKMHPAMRISRRGQTGPASENGAELLGRVKAGARVTIRTPQGQERTGRAVMRSSGGGWVLNMGGAHGTPGLVDERNIVKVHGKRKLREVAADLVAAHPALRSDATVTPLLKADEAWVARLPLAEALLKHKAKIQGELREELLDHLCGCAPVEESALRLQDAREVGDERAIKLYETLISAVS